MIWMIALPGVTVNGNPGLEDATPLVLGKQAAAADEAFKALPQALDYLRRPLPFDVAGNPFADRGLRVVA